jgi:hypothetical protein
LRYVNGVRPSRIANAAARVTGQSLGQHEAALR